jgi:hypothetical protein
MGWASLFSGGLAGRARPGNLVGHHCGECALYVLDGLVKGGVCRDEVVDGGVILDGRVAEVVQ